ncbi:MULTISPECIES: winged helix-turn-helix transcriptional regulator [unclassified Streptomyces]|uniref:winged helix-turn-helix transcriptional regulator n=1 Tax=unclassified Streptomyces TaxID=2593676 RepID=UPI00382B650E
MDYLDQDTSNCSVGRAVDLLGQPWVLLILREVSRGIRRFSDMQNHLGVSRSVLSDRLNGLVERGVLEMRDYQEPGTRRRSEYVLTPMGKDLYPLITALRNWGDKYLADPEGPSLLATHHGCGAPVRVALMCEDGHVVASGDEVDRRPGPGARARVRA